MREIITQLQPGREEGKQGRGGGRGTGARGEGGVRGRGDRRDWRGRHRMGCRNVGRGLPPSVTRFLGVWERR